MYARRVQRRSDDLGPLRRSGVCVREPRRRLGAGHRMTRATGGTADRTAQRTSDKCWDTAPHGPGSRREHLLVPSNYVVLSYMYQYIVYIRDRERVCSVMYIFVGGWYISSSDSTHIKHLHGTVSSSSSCDARSYAYRLAVRRHGGPASRIEAG